MSGKIQMRTEALILGSSALFTLFYNVAFFRNVLVPYPPSANNIFFLLSLTCFLGALTAILLGLVSTRHTVRAVLSLLFPCAALASYFMNSYNIVIDTEMIQNVLMTNPGEALDLFTWELLFYFAVLGVAPAMLVWRVAPLKRSLRKGALARAKLLGGSLAVILLGVGLSTSHYTTFIREHKLLRYYTNPATFLYSTGNFISNRLDHGSAGPRQALGLDAKIPETDLGRELIILVVGETARSDHFSLNGYARETNPLLPSYKRLSFHEIQACATSTALSLPCMFSHQDAENFDIEEAGEKENLLDVLQHAGVHVLWRDNNSDAKGLAEAVSFEDFKSPEVNPVCDIECRDVGMLAGLGGFIDAHQAGDIVIVLHQMGNHGPAYYKRYPEEFARYTPVCATNQLEQCSTEEIINAYDNALLYTDYFLSRVIEFLTGYDDRFETAMLYVSDHGESLGEHGLYLHGLPNFIAPDEQTRVPLVLWFGRNYHLGPARTAAVSPALSHDNYFHTVLGLMEIETHLYNPDKDFVHGALPAVSRLP